MVAENQENNEEFDLKKIRKYIILFILFFIIFITLINISFVLTDILADKKGIKFLSIIYSRVGNEEWLGFWGNVMAGILPLGIIFYNEKEAKRQQKQFKEERQLQQEQFNKQLELQEKYKKQEFYVKKFDKEKTLAYELLTEFDKKIYSNLFRNFQNILLIINSSNIKEVDKNKSFEELTKKFLVIRHEIIDKINNNITLLDSMGWRINFKGADSQKFYILRKECHANFIELRDNLTNTVGILTERVLGLQNSPTANFQHEDILLEQSLKHDEIFNNTLNNLLVYFTYVDKCIIECKFDDLEIKI